MRTYSWSVGSRESAEDRQPAAFHLELVRWCFDLQPPRDGGAATTRRRPSPYPCIGLGVVASILHLPLTAAMETTYSLHAGRPPRTPFSIHQPSLLLAESGGGPQS